MKKTINRDYAHLEDFVGRLPSGLFAYTGEVLHDERNCVKLMEVDGERVVVKRFKRPNAFNRVVYTLIRGSKAARSYRNALRLQRLGIATPTPIGFVDVKEHGLIRTSYLVTAYTDYRPIDELIYGSQRDNEVLFNCFVRFAVTLHEKGIRHKDFNASNVLYKKNPSGRYDFMLIDVNRMRFGWMGRRECARNIERICTNPDFMFRFAKRYAELRNWNVYRCIAGFAAFRGLFEVSRDKKKHIKQWAKGLAKA